MPKNILNTLLVFICIVALVSCATAPRSVSTPILNESASTQPTPTTRAHITEDAFWQGNSDTTWDRLQHVPLKTLEATDPDEYRTAWIELAIISKRYSKYTPQLVQQLIAWRQKYPTHPGNQFIPNNDMLNALLTEAPAKHIALLLPLSGPLASSGQAVRDGFLNAYYESLANTHVQQTISFYDTATNSDTVSLYQKALSEGADRVVGPLIKENVEALLSMGNFTVPTLALNYTENALPPHFYEFGLSPLQESQQIADKAWQSGHSRAIIIAPQNAWGQRVTANLVSRWQSQGGTVTDTLYFSPQTDFAKAIANLLRVSDDKNKKNNPQNRRQDFDVIFLLSQPQEARAIVPLLKFNYANSIPIYATSSVYAGSPNPQKDTDLNGIIFSDIPWVLHASHTNTNRLYAVGRDAYMISNQLSRLTSLPNFPIYAATGALTLTPTQHIYRRLPSAQMRNGHP